MAYNLSLEFDLPAKPARIMQLLTDSALIRKWSGGEGTVETKPGGKFEMFDGWVFGEVIQASPTELSYTWKTTDWDEAAAPSTVHYVLKADEDGTKLLLTHTGFPDQAEMDEHKNGWTDYFFQPMEDFIMVFDKR